MGAAAGWEWDLGSVLYALVWNTCGEVRAQHIVSGRQEAVMMWAKKDLANDQSECRETLERQSEGECSQRNASHVHINMCARSLLNLNAITCLYQQKLPRHYFFLCTYKIHGGGKNRGGGRKPEAILAMHSCLLECVFPHIVKQNVDPSWDLML